MGTEIALQEYPMYVIPTLLYGLEVLVESEYITLESFHGQHIR